MNAPQMGRRGQAWPSRWLAPSASQGAYVIRALPDLCLGIVSERLGHLDPWISFHGQLLESPGTPGAFFYVGGIHCKCANHHRCLSAEGGLQPEPGITDDDSEKILNVIRTRV